ncbi:hypothetical protein BDV34DRAFT_204376 [Aspergillus parasiticus]|uniref:Uncharacterized protein n=1 Tax=Aspergillus parasiticus TaxID=5067 RepID=A0A5N6D5Z3_ASPPA|nr:hypothetical protein BDV34DRAFT_204376 [Aspergillus parasiticus]
MIQCGWEALDVSIGKTIGYSGFFFFFFISQLAINVVPAISLLPSPLICLVGTFCSLVSRT